MAQKAAFTDKQVKAAGLALRQRGIEPAPGSLRRELGERGYPTTMWNTWLKYRDGEEMQAFPLDFPGVCTAKTEQMTNARQGFQNSVACLIAQACSETAKPLHQQIEALKSGLSVVIGERDSFAEMADGLSDEVMQLTDENAKLRSVALGEKRGGLILL